MRKFATRLITFSVFLVTTLGASASADSNAGGTASTHADEVKRDDGKTEDFKAIERRFADWTEAFNRRDLDGSCALFSKSIRADHQGVPTEDWPTMRARFQKLFADTSREYKYSFKLINVYRSGDLAVGRITWYLTVTKDGKPLFEEETQSMDVFKPNKDGVWEMVDFVSFTELDKSDQKKKSAGSQR